jgi:type II secretory pathway pseudopilin PulG
MHKQKANWFTLIELIIVVTILWILSTIAFVSFQSYSKNARDSNRLETMSIVQKGISLNQVTTSKTLLPDDYTQVLASWSLLWYEWIVWESVTRWIQMNSIPKDPIRWDNYIYYTNKDRNKVQVMWFLEWEDLAFIWIDRANAAWSWTNIPKVSWDRLWILLDVNNNRVTWSWVDILLTNSWTSYTTYFSNSDNLTSSWKDLYSKVYNRIEDLLKDTNLASLDDSLVWYWDMETFSWTMLKDLSKYSNNLTSSWSPNIVNCKIWKCVDLWGKTFFNIPSLTGSTFTWSFSISL